MSLLVAIASTCRTTDRAITGRSAIFPISGASVRRPLVVARALFASMGYTPALDESEALVQRTAATSVS